MTRMPQETYVYSDNKGMPGTLIMSGLPELEGQEMYALLDGENLEHYKIGYEIGSYDSGVTLKKLKQMFPDRYEKIMYV